MGACSSIRRQVVLFFLYSNPYARRRATENLQRFPGLEEENTEYPCWRTCHPVTSLDRMARAEKDPTTSALDFSGGELFTDCDS